MNQLYKTKDRENVLKLKELCEQYLEENTTFVIEDAKGGICDEKLDEARRYLNAFVSVIPGGIKLAELVIWESNQVEWLYQKAEAAERDADLIQAIFQDVGLLGQRPEIGDGIRHLKHFSELSPNGYEVIDIFKRLDQMTEDQFGEAVKAEQPTLAQYDGF